MADDRPILREVGDFKSEMDARGEENKAFLREFERWLMAQGLSDKTVDRHWYNADYFLNGYLLDEQPLTMREGLEYVFDFLGTHLIQEAGWSKIRVLKENITSIKKFYQCMAERGHVSQKDYDDLVAMIAANKDRWYAENQSYIDSHTSSWSYSPASTGIGDLLDNPFLGDMMGSLSPNLVHDLAGLILDSLNYSPFDVPGVAVEPVDENLEHARNEVFDMLILAALYLKSERATDEYGHPIRIARKDVLTSTVDTTMKYTCLLEFGDHAEGVVRFTDFGLDASKGMMMSLGYDQLAEDF